MLGKAEREHKAGGVAALLSAAVKHNRAALAALPLQPAFGQPLGHSFCPHKGKEAIVLRNPQKQGTETGFLTEHREGTAGERCIPRNAS